MPKSFLSLINLSLRCLNLASKFILIILLAKLLSMEEFGTYGLIAATLILTLYLVGLDFYVFSNREILKSSDPLIHNQLVSSHLNLIALTHLFTFPIVYLLFYYNILPMKYLLLFYGILILEHLNQEIMRLLIIFNKPILSNLLFFIRSSAWVIVIYLLSIFNITLTLHTVLIIWLTAEILCLVLSIPALKNTSLKINKQFNLIWIKKGLKIAIPFMLGTLAIKFIFTIDRYYIDNFYTADILSAYVFYASMAAATLSFMDAAVFTFEYPKLVKDIQQNHNQHRIIIKRFLIKTICFLIIINLSAFILIKYLLHIVDKEIFVQYLYYFYMLMLINTIYCLSMIPHYILYGLHKDKLIITSHILTLIMFVTSILVLNFLEASISNLFSALIISFSFLLAYKTYFSNKLIRLHEHSNIS